MRWQRIGVGLLLALLCLSPRWSWAQGYTSATLQSAAVATGNGTALSVRNYSLARLQVSGTFSGTVAFEGSGDGTNYVALSCSNDSTGSHVTTTTSAGLFSCPVSGLLNLRARVSVYSSGSITVTAGLMQQVSWSSWSMGAGVGTSDGAANALQMSDGAGGFLSADAATFATSLTGPLINLGSGDAQSIYNPATGQNLYILKGTAASPDSTLQPLIKCGRLISVAAAALSGSDGGEFLACITSIAKSDASGQAQPIGVFGGAETASTSDGGGTGNDAVGLYGLGRVVSSGTGIGIGVFAAGRRDTNTGQATGLEAVANNKTATPVTYSAAGYNDTQGIWVAAAGDSAGGVGLNFGNPFNVKWSRGISFASANGGPAADVTIQDNGNATTSLSIQGTHTVALTTASTAGRFNLNGAADTAGRQFHNLGTFSDTGTANNFSLFANAVATHTSGTLTIVAGINGQGVFSTAGSGIVSQLIGVRGGVTANASGTSVSRLAALYAATNTAATATITANTGLWIEAQSGGTTAYGIYSQHTGKSYFSGSVHVDSPATLTIVDTVTTIAPACNSMTPITAASAVATSTTTFTAPSATAGTGNKGCVTHVCNVGTTNTITLKRGANFFAVSGADLALPANSCVGVVSDGTQWRQATAVLTAT